MPKVDANGIVTEGRYKGYALDDVLNFTETLEEAAKGQGHTDPGKEPAKPAGRTPEENLASANNDRLGALHFQTARRLEMDDEHAFAQSVKDYPKYAERIAEMKKTMAPEARVVQGVHRQLYILVKGNDPETLKTGVLFDPAETVVPTEEVEEVEVPAEVVQNEPPAEPAKPASTPAPAPARTKPQAAPPSAQPSPAARSAAVPAKPKAPKGLIPNDRIRSWCKAMNITVDDYMKKLEAEGRTQEEIDQMSVTSQQRSTPRSILHGR